MREDDYDEYLYQEYLEKLYHEKEMEIHAKFQCIYLLVEGESEEFAFSYLLDEAEAGLDIIDFKKDGIVVANYGGAGNLAHSLRLLQKTLSHARPVVATIDNDLEGKWFKEHEWPKLKQEFDTSKIFIFEIPNKGVVNFTKPNGETFLGGSYEEIYEPDYFIDCCFSDNIIPPHFALLKDDFLIGFDKTKPWFDQVQKYLAIKGYKKFKDSKLNLAKMLADNVDDWPQTIIDLAEKIKEVRNKFPVVHLDNLVD